MRRPLRYGGQRRDLTRWNRAGRARFDYVDGDAAVWLEEMRIALLGLTARGAPLGRRAPEAWRDLFMRPAAEWPDAATQASLRAMLAWPGLWRSFPDAPETSGVRNARLLADYGAPPGDHGREILRAFARAAHVLLGHLDAYANEGYLRTATQWENLRRLAAMVNYQPRPPASASTPVALALDPKIGLVEIEAGLAMKHAPDDGGPPVVFETLAPLLAHPALDAVRAVGWDRDTTPAQWTQPAAWQLLDNDPPTPGSLAVVANRAGGAAAGVTVASVTHDADTDTAMIRVAAPPGTAPSVWAAVLHAGPKAIRRGLPRSGSGRLVVAVDAIGSFPVGSIAEIRSGATAAFAVVTGQIAGRLTLATTASFTGSVEVRALTPFGSASGLTETSPGIEALRFPLVDNGIAVNTGFYRSSTGTLSAAPPSTGTVSRLFFPSSNAKGPGYALMPDARAQSGSVVGAPPPVIAGAETPAARVVAFLGKPPKGLAAGDRLVAETAGGALSALTVVAVTEADDSHQIVFAETVPDADAAETVRFHGPMTARLDRVAFDRSPAPAFAGRTITVAPPPAVAAALVRPGRLCLITDDREAAAPVLAAVAASVPVDGGLQITVDGTAGLGGFVAGWTRLHLNTAMAGHGETQPARTLGSGDAEQARQAFDLSVRDISFVASPGAATGVAPALEIAVDGETWPYRDLIDPQAEGTRAYSVVLQADDTLRVVFRRRLPTGLDTVVLRRHRTGAGPRGLVPAGVFDKPMAPHGSVKAVLQPLPSSGGDDREPVAAIRSNAPSGLAANGRAVTAEDLARLARGRAGLWQAAALLEPDPVRGLDLRLVVVPAHGAALTDALRAELRAFLGPRTLPGLRFGIERHVDLPLEIAATVKVDGTRFDATAVRTAAEAALLGAFALKARGLGQPAYVAEAIAALEAVPGVDAVIVGRFAPAPGAPAPRRVAPAPGTTAIVRALFPRANQVVRLDGPSALGVTLEVTG